MSFRASVGLAAVWLTSLLVVGMLAKGQAFQSNPLPEPVIISGSDIGFRFPRSIVNRAVQFASKARHIRRQRDLRGDGRSHAGDRAGRRRQDCHKRHRLHCAHSRHSESDDHGRHEPTASGGST